MTTPALGLYRREECFSKFSWEDWAMARSSKEPAMHEGIILIMEESGWEAMFDLRDG
jgi:hypothetical protein